ncbi:MAG: hypothetical protein OXC44_01135 [Proteobacteria bacterium]|nr:hypothetical protein [Pseudomonadota bacterium]
MKVQFQGSSPEDILTLFQEKIKGRKIAKLLNLSLVDHSLTISVSKLGTSRFLFHVHTDQPLNCITISLYKKHVPFTHRAMEKDIVAKITRIIEDCGGTIITPYT